MIYLKDASGTGFTPVSTSNPIPVSLTGTVVVPSTSTNGIQLYNTADQTTNYERLEALWSSNVATIQFSRGGSGSSRVLIIKNNSTGANLQLPSSGFGLSINTSVTSSSQPLGQLQFPATWTNTSGSGAVLYINPTYNQASGTAANTDFKVERTETALGSGAQRLMELGTVALGAQFSVTNRGGLIVSAQALSGAGGVNVTNYSTFLTSTGVAQALTLADGTAGQIKTIIHQVDGGSMVLTPTTKIGFTTITFTNVGDACTLQYTGAGWAIIGIFGAVAA